MCYYCDITKNSELKIKVLHPLATVPKKREEDSGYDVYGIIGERITIILPGKNIIVPTGLSMELPQGLGFIIANRSSVGTRCAIVGAEVVDSGYRGEVRIDLHNISNEPLFITDLGCDELLDMIMAGEVTEMWEYGIDESGCVRKVVEKGELNIIPRSKALVQGLIIPTLHLPVRVVAELSDSERKEDGFGSTNLR